MNRRGFCSILLLCATAQAQTQPAQTQPAQTQPAQTQPATQPFSSLGDATRITLKLDKVSIKEAFDRLEKQSKIQVALAQRDLLLRNDTTISVDFDNEPYLSALIELCRQANLSVSTFGPRLMILASGDRRRIPPHAASGPTMIFCNALTLVHEIHFGEHDRTTATAILNFSLASEPRLPIMGLESGSTQITAVDDHGRSLPIADTQLFRQPQRELFNESRLFVVPLKVDPAASGTIGRLSGRVIARVVSKTEPLTIKDLLSSQGVSTTAAGTTFTVTRVEPTGAPGQFQVDLDVTSATLSSNFFARLLYNDNDFRPRMDPPGNTLQVTNARANGDGTTITLMVTLIPQTAGDKKPANLVWTLPSQITRVEIPFEFRGLKLHP